MTKPCFSAVAVCAVLTFSVLGCGTSAAPIISDDGQQPPIYEFSISPDSNRMVTRGFTTELNIRDLKSKKILQRLRHGDSFPASVVYHTRRDAILIGYVDGCVTIWERDDSDYRSRVIGQHMHSVKVSSVSPDGRYAATGDQSGEIYLWKFDETPRIIKRWTTPNPVSALQFSPDGSLLATANQHDTLVTLRPIDDDTRSDRVIENQSTPKVVSFSKDGKFLAVGDVAGILTLTDLAANRTVWARTIYESGIRSVAFSPQGGQLAVTGQLENWVEFRNTATGNLEDSYTAHRSTIAHIAFTDAGQLVTCGHDGNIHDGPNDSLE